MPRRQTPFIQGLYYRIYNRGNNRPRIFFQPENYVYFLRNVKRSLAPLAQVTAFCLMPTHYHLLARVKTSEFLTRPSQSQDRGPKKNEYRHWFPRFRTRVSSLAREFLSFNQQTCCGCRIRFYRLLAVE
jgi:hypothetical protein